MANPASSHLFRTFLIPGLLALVAVVPAWQQHDWPLYSLFVVICYFLGLQMQRNQKLLQSNQEQDAAIKEARRKHDEEKLRTALLSSVSHDLKTPLVTMLGAATSLRDLHKDLDAKDQAELLDSIISETRRLESYIQNLLDMTRLGHGKLSLSRGWVSVPELYNVVSKRIQHQFPQQAIQLQLATDLPPLHVHAALIEQAVFNGLENACKATANQGQILVEASLHHKAPDPSATLNPSEAPAHEAFIALKICDQGPGLPTAEWEAVFDQFYTFSQGDRYEKGSGLGLSICRSIFRVHRGDARIIPAPAGYSHCLYLELPVAATSYKAADHSRAVLA